MWLLNCCTNEKAFIKSICRAILVYGNHVLPRNCPLCASSVRPLPHALIFCRRTLNLCDRYPFRLLIKSVSAISGRDMMVVELLLFFSCVCFWVFFGWFWFVSCCFFLLFGCLYIAVSVFCLAYANFSNIPLGSFKITININYGNWLTLLTIINLEIFKELSAVNSLGEKNRTDKDKLPIAVRKDKHNT